MSSDDIVPRRGAHRARRSILRASLPLLVALVGVAAVVTAFSVFYGKNDNAALTGTSTSRTPSTTRPAPTPKTTAPVVTSPAPRPSSSSPVTHPTSPPATRTHTSPPATPGTAVTTPPVASKAFQVAVLNETTRQGLAAGVARMLRAKGWNVGAVGNFRGTVGATTVFYPPGGKAAAEALAASLAVHAGVAPRFGHLSPVRLTVILTGNYP